MYIDGIQHFFPMFITSTVGRRTNLSFSESWLYQKNYESSCWYLPLYTFLACSHLRCNFALLGYVYTSPCIFAEIEHFFDIGIVFVKVITVIFLRPTATSEGVYQEDAFFVLSSESTVIFHQQSPSCISVKDRQHHRAAD